MKLITLFALTGLSGLTSAQEITNKTGPSFAFDDYSIGCSPGGCITSFNLTYDPPYSNSSEAQGWQPPFVAQCAVVTSRVQEEWTDCDLIEGGGETPDKPNNLTGTGTSFVRTKYMPLSEAQTMRGDRLVAVRHGYWDLTRGTQRKWVVEAAGGINMMRTDYGAGFLVANLKVGQAV